MTFYTHARAAAGQRCFEALAVLLQAHAFSTFTPTFMSGLICLQIPLQELVIVDVSVNRIKEQAKCQEYYLRIEILSQRLPDFGRE